MAAEFLSRRAVRHELIRRRNERIVELRDDSWPAHLLMHTYSLEDLRMDSDPAEAQTMDFEGKEFMNIPVITDDRLEHGEFRVAWPSSSTELGASDG
jgi:hypothetical protein